MSILIDKNTRVMVQGLGRDGSFHAKQMKEYGTNVVAGVHPGKGGISFQDFPVFNTAEEAVRETGAECSVIFVPAPFAADAVLAGANAGIGLIVAVSEGIPVLDMSKIVRELNELGTVLIGPNSPGLLSPEKSKVGIMPGSIFKRGSVGVISRSGTLTYEVVNQLSLAGYGQSTAIGMGGDPIVGMKYNDYLERFENDEETELMVIVGEIGGTDEQDAATFIKESITKPVVGYIVGRSAPPGKRMGHAGAIISGADSTADAKVEFLRESGIPVADTVEQIVDLVGDELGGQN
ncbi:MAG: succinate--CoA ligase subunit alpha [Candidatus Aegiribacteria sp.]|nr:succinate--CoA ligase subunit alpha [Candidatus Aegiribacteria sp.]